MPRIDPSGLVLAQLRAQALAWRRAPRLDPGPGGARTSGTGAAHKEEWLARVARGVAAISADLPERPRRAFRIYLEALLARECGVRHADEPEFQSLVDRVVETMAADPRLRAAMETAGDLLLRSVGA